MLPDGRRFRPPTEWFLIVLMVVGVVLSLAFGWQVPLKLLGGVLVLFLIVIGLTGDSTGATRR